MNVKLAQAALDVMERRPLWGVIPIDGENYQVVERRGGTVVGVNSLILSDCPFDALVRTDRWQRENVEGLPPG